MNRFPRRPRRTDPELDHALETLDLLTAYLADGPEAAPTDLLPEAMRRLRPRRPRFLDRFGGLHALAFVAAVVVLAVVVQAVVLNAPQAGPAASPVATQPPPAGSPSNPIPTPTPTAIPMAAVGLEGSPMPNGRYRTVFFQPGFEFSIAADRWVSSQDLPRQWFLRGLRDTSTGPGNDALTIVHIENLYVDPCAKGTDGGTQPWTGNAAAFMDWLTSTLPTSPGDPTETTFFGLPALQLDLVQAELPECVLGYLPITDVGRPFTTVLPGAPIRYTAVDVDGQTLLAATWATDPAGWPEVRAAADEVLGTIEFN